MMTDESAKKSGDRFLFCASLCGFLLILSFPAATAAGVRSGLDLCYRSVVPSVFPSIVLTSLLFSRSGGFLEKTVGRVFSRLFRVSPRGAAAWIAGLLAGFPVGAITVANDVKAGLLTREEGEHLLSFVNNTGPAFLVGAVGLGMFDSVRLGWALWLFQIPVSLTVGLLFRPRNQLLSNVPVHSADRRVDPVSAIVSASETSVRIVGFVCFFSAVSSLLSVFLPAGLPLAWSTALLEIGAGASHAAQLPFPFPALPQVGFAVCFSGLSVHFQTIAVMKQAGIGASKYIKGKITSGAIGFFLFSLLCLTN